MVLKGSSLCVKSSSNSIRAIPRVFNRVILGVKTCEVFLCVQAIIFKWLLCIILSFSATREFHTEYEPFNHPFSGTNYSENIPYFVQSVTARGVPWTLTGCRGRIIPWGWGYFRIVWVGMCLWTLEPLAYTYTRAAQPPPPPPPPLSSVAVFQKLVKSLANFSQNKTDLLFLYFWVAIPSFPSLESNLQLIDQFPGK